MKGKITFASLGLLLLGFVLATAGQAWAEQDNDSISRQLLSLTEGKSQLSLSGHVAEHESRDYVLPVEKGHVYRILLKSTNEYNRFNIMAGEDIVFDGSIRGNQFEGSFEKGGNYTIRIYLTSNVAHRNGHGQYTLEIERLD